MKKWIVIAAAVLLVAAIVIFGPAVIMTFPVSSGSFGYKPGVESTVSTLNDYFFVPEYTGTNKTVASEFSAKGQTVAFNDGVLYFTNGREVQQISVNAQQPVVKPTVGFSYEYSPDEKIEQIHVVDDWIFCSRTRRDRVQKYRIDFASLDEEKEASGKYEEDSILDTPQFAVSQNAFYYPIVKAVEADTNLYTCTLSLKKAYAESNLGFYPGQYHEKTHFRTNSEEFKVQFQQNSPCNPDDIRILAYTNDYILFSARDYSLAGTPEVILLYNIRRSKWKIAPDSMQGRWDSVFTDEAGSFIRCTTIDGNAQIKRYVPDNDWSEEIYSDDTSVTFGALNEIDFVQSDVIIGWSNNENATVLVQNNTRTILTNEWIDVVSCPGDGYCYYYYHGDADSPLYRMRLDGTGKEKCG